MVEEEKEMMREQIKDYFLAFYNLSFFNAPC